MVSWVWLPLAFSCGTICATFFLCVFTLGKRSDEG